MTHAGTVRKEARACETSKERTVMHDANTNAVREAIARRLTSAQSYPAHDSHGEREGAVAEASKVSLQLSSHEKVWV